MQTPKEKEEFKAKQEDAYNNSMPMQPNSTYLKLRYLFYYTVISDDGWGKNKTYSLFKDEEGKILRTRQIKTLMYFETGPEPAFKSIEELIAYKPRERYQVTYGKEYHLVTGPDASVTEVYGNGLAVFRKGSKIIARKIQ